MQKMQKMLQKLQQGLTTLLTSLICRNRQLKYAQELTAGNTPPKWTLQHAKTVWAQ